MSGGFFVRGLAMQDFSIFRHPNEGRDLAFYLVATPNPGLQG
jgi:hypothetical protein